jgi:hypothetical protein
MKLNVGHRRDPFSAANRQRPDARGGITIELFPRIKSVIARLSPDGKTARFSGTWSKQDLFVERRASRRSR